MKKIFHNKVLVAVLILQLVLMGNISAIETNYAATAAAATATTTPTFISTYPKITNITNQGFNLIVQTNQATTVYAALCKVYKGSGDTSNNPYKAPSKSYVRLMAANGSNSDLNTECQDLFGMVGYNKITVNSTGKDIITPFNNLNTNLDPTAIYVIYSIMQYSDQSGNQAYTSVQSMTFKMPASFSNGFPRYIVNTDSTVTIQTQIDNAGASGVYYVVLNSSAADPTSEQFEQWIAGTASTNNDVISKGNITLSNKNGSTYGEVANLSGLPSVGSYNIYEVTYMTNSAGNKIIRASQKVPMIDLRNPNFTLSYPQISNVTGTSFDLSVASDKTCTAYYIVTANSTSYTADAIINGSTSSGEFRGSISNVSSIAAASTSITGLNPATTYNIYVVLQDTTTGKNISTIYSTTMQTIDTIPPVFVSGYPQTKNNLGKTIDLVVEASKVCTAYYLAIPLSSDTTSIDKSVDTLTNDTTNYSTITGASSGRISIIQKNSEVTTTIANLISGTDYNIYVALKDANKNKTDKTSTMKVTTAVDLLAPDFAKDGSPKCKLTALNEGEISLKLDKNGTIYFIDSIKKFTNDELSKLKIIYWAQQSSWNKKTDMDGVDFVGMDTRNSSYTKKMTNLTVNEKHYVYMILENYNSGGKSSNIKGPFELTDSIKPSFEWGYPSTSNVLDKSLDLKIKAKKACTAYYLVIPKTSDTDKVDKSVSALTNDSNTYNTVSGSIKGTINNSKDKANTEVLTTIRELTPGTEYKIYVALKDSSGNISDRWDTSATTVDTIAPTFTSDGNPSGKLTSLNDGKSNNGQITLKVNKTSNIYYIDTTSILSSSQLTVNNIKTWAQKMQTSNQNNTAIGVSSIDYGYVSKNFSSSSIFSTNTINLNNITANADHYVYMVLENTNTNGDSSAVQGPFKLTDTIKPSFEWYYPSTTNVLDESFDLKIKCKKVGTAYYLVIPKTSDNNSIAKDASALTNDSNTYSTIIGAIKGTINNSKDKANTEVITTIYGLIANTEYKVYMVLKDSNGNVSDRWDTSVTTQNAMAPAFISGYPKASQNSATSINLAVKATKVCTEYYVVIPDSSDKSVDETVTSLTDNNKIYTYYGNIAGAISGKLEITQDKLGSEVATIISGLVAGTKYNIYVALKDKNGNQIDKPFNTSLTT